MRQHVLARSISLSLAVTLATSAFAQQPTPRRPAGNRAPPIPTLPAPPRTAPAANTPIAIPPPPTVNDPMLAPVPAATKNVGSWEQALDLVRARSTDLRIAYDQIKAAEAQSRVALSSSLPTLTGNGIATYNFLVKDLNLPPGTTSPTGTNTNPARSFLTGSATLQLPLIAPRQWYSVGTAHRAEDVARFSVEDAKRTIALNVASTLIAVVTSERVAELNRIGFRSALERLELTQRKKALGAATGLDVVRAQQDVERARATLVTGDESLRQSRESLGLALGIAEPIGVESSISLDGIQRSTQTACRPATLEQRADIAAARARLTQSERAITDANLGYSPTLTADSTVFATSIDNPIAQNPTWNIRAILSIPFYDGGVRDAQRRAAYATTDQAEQDLVARRRTAQIEVLQARRGVTVATDSRNVAADARALAAETDRLTRAQYIEGEGTSLELVTAAAALREAEVNLALREFELVRARVISLLALANCPF